MHGWLSAGAELSTQSPLDLHPVWTSARRTGQPGAAHRDGSGRQLTPQSPQSPLTLAQSQGCKLKFICEDFEVVTVGTRKILLASMLSSGSGAELTDSTLRQDVLSLTPPLPHRDDFKPPPSDSTVISTLDQSSQDFYFPRILSLASPRSGVDIEFNLRAGARTGDSFCQDQYSDRSSSNEKLANLKEKPKLICRST